MRIKKMTSRRAQMEMIGIAIVVVIIVMGFLFVLKANNKPPQTGLSGFVRAHITQDILNSMSIADADCSDLDMTELLKACAENKKEVECGDACIIFKELSKDLLSQTLEEQKLPYRLRVYKNDPPVDESGAIEGIFIEYAGCNETSLNRGRYVIKERPGMLVVPTSIGDIKVMLEICSNPY